MSEASERLRLLESDHSPDGWPAVQMRDITAVLDELDAMHAAQDAMHEGQKRLTAIYVERGRMIAAMRQLMDATH
jgi:hypothetical protein